LEFSGKELGWPASAHQAQATFLPNLGGFVGSDILALILATGLHQGGAPRGAVDLGTNGEIVFTSGGSLWVASTAAGPAFEGAHIRCGMRAAEGAIDKVEVSGGNPLVHVIGGVPARGLCGSGLVDAVARGLDLGSILCNGRMSPDPWALAPGVELCQQDVRELQLAKGAVAAGIQILTEGLGLKPGQVEKFFLAGAFGNSLDKESGLRIGLFPFQSRAVESVGNTALRGAKIMLCQKDLGEAQWKPLLGRVRHVPLEQRPDFQELFAGAMAFPG
jgi:uncharacterized 2Fe-2S/4Fe-4S cluster protein (DUF4445 family)